MVDNNVLALVAEALVAARREVKLASVTWISCRLISCLL